MSTEERYNGWANRETWAVALHINNDQGWQESVLETVRNTVEGIQQDPPAWLELDQLTDAFYANRVGDAILDNVEETLDYIFEASPDTYRMVRGEIGSFWRVDWAELGAAFLEDQGEEGATD